MHTRQLKAFLTIVESGSIRAAARVLRISQPALSKSLRQLEEELAVPLLQRSVRGVVPTEFGKALMARALTIDHELRRAKEEIAQIRGERNGNIVVGLSAVSALLMASDALGRFWRRYPTSGVRVVDGVFDLVLVGLRQGSLDFSIGPLPMTQSAAEDMKADMEAEPLFENVIVPVVRKGHPLARARSLAELQASRWIIIGTEPGSVDLIMDNFTDHGLDPPHRAVTSQSFPAFLELIAENDMVSALPLSLLQHWMLRDRLQALEIQERLRTTAICLVKRAGVPLTPLAHALAQEFRRSARRFR